MRVVRTASGWWVQHAVEAPPGFRVQPWGQHVVEAPGGGDRCCLVHKRLRSSSASSPTCGIVSLEVLIVVDPRLSLLEIRRRSLGLLAQKRATYLPDGLNFRQRTP